MNSLRTAPRPVKIALGAAVLLAVGLLVASGVLSLRVGEPDSADPVDVGFSQDMSVHHLQGVRMASLAREKSQDRLIRQLAFDIETTQLEQTGRMKGWLSLWNEPDLAPGNPMTWMAGEHDQHASQRTAMPGMAAKQDLDRLRSLDGPEFDVFFLQLMIRHHRGGAPMMQYAAQEADRPQVRNLAQQMLTAQTAEIDAMRRMLEERGARPLPD
ncbi:Uncharacterized conserved protein, DUF305 family [Saccharopolyspora kobensis]|uniref:Uncharacterized conserved protein, DUF305 family n=1 Tax=Saccharopolyspora kobensis TaxID=146035 RepID=A0A1H6AAI4_9PSEU|nr:DUF305 domain-containing protein [Saccharopolyspora kobensis]SEG45204.1 Uncharacterized conserved protein, DUF305 family [Saccharopolyspora kobensis]SFE52677.1 Uncharacterized conserved protein, DUF305 family [Saccharopolyspora kobensis]